MTTSQVQREVMMAKTIRSFGHRWGVMMPILSNSHQPNNRVTPSILTEKALAKIEKRHTETVSDLLRGWDKTGREKLVAEIMAADSEVVRIFFTTDMSLNEARTAMETRLCPPPNPPAESPVSSVAEPKPDIPVAEDLPADRAAKDSTPALSEEEKQSYITIMAALAIDRIQQCSGIEQNLEISDVFVKLVRAISPDMRRKDVARFVIFVKESAAGKSLPSDWDDDIPF